ncbi:DUF3489 domain-containing protein [Serpentinimonas maccroryi]|uniref:DUF3489 domain-containing protein n=1 Tax=Serpentinimonas maccroryi TaxID=1458426 RepID=UPI00203433F3|nr:DUF3489 domain-containing protein [Serpentinimonas maccroryi]MCM2479193.1 DUF3489 domain-containing protein [Serpentinimonas maccroryi]
MTNTQLTLTQHAVLSHAIHNADGKVVWLPEHIKGGARQKVLEGLAKRDLIVSDGSDWFVATAGYEAMGCTQPAPPTLAADPEIEAAVAAAEATWAPAAQDGTEPKPRHQSKQALVIELLQRPQGATIAQVCAATGWLAHTVRGTFAGAFKKKLGLHIASEKLRGGERTYRIA